MGAASKVVEVSGAAFISGVGPWCSVVILVVSILSAMAILARYRQGTEVLGPALLALAVSVAGAVLALLVVLVPYLLASPPIDDRALAAAIGTPHWLWPATLAIVAWVWVLAYSTWTMRLLHRQQGPASATVGRKRRVSHG